MDKLIHGTTSMIQVSSSPSSSSSLDSKKLNRNKRCGFWSLEGELSNRTYYSRLRCKAWKCPRCGPKKVKQIRRGIIERATQKNLCRFLTLTLNPRYCTPDGSISYIRRCWNELRTYLKRRYKASISFIAVVELQQSGYAHLHILVDRYIEQSWIKKAWQAVRGGEIVDIRYVDIHRIGPYMAKYLTKEVFLAPFAPRQRRYSTSRGIALISKTNPGKWVLIKVPIEFLFTLRRERLLGLFCDQQGTLQSYELSSA